MRAAGGLLLLLAASLASFAQTAAPAGDPKETRIESDFRKEAASLAACKEFNFGGLSGCGQTLIMGQPMHIAVGSLAPQNGIGAGLAFVEHKDFVSEWRANWDVDAQATANGSWRAGAYMKAYRLGGGPIKMTFASANEKAKASEPFFGPSKLFNLYSQSISLNRVDYFGLGAYTTPLTHTTYGFSENVTGVTAAIPLAGPFASLKASLLGELNGRFPSVRAGSDATIPSIGQIFTEATAPGLTRGASYFEPAEGIRLYPALLKDHIRLDYLLQFQQFIAPDSGFSFRRWNGDFSHQIPLYQLLPGKLGKWYSDVRAPATQQDGPDDCTGVASNISPVRAAKTKIDPARPCPAIATLAKLEGSITLRAFLSESFAGKGDAVPFYMMPTIGGSNINGTAMLASYPDYRFRGPDLMLFTGTLEHSIGKLPIGGIFSVDEGKVGVRRGDVNLDHLRHTFSAGLTVHAGGLPVVELLFAWGGLEGTHTAATVSPTLLGGSARPSLF